MASGNFARGLLPYLPGVADNLSRAVSEGPQRARQKRLGEMLTPSDPNAQAPMMTDLGGQGGPMTEIPQASRERAEMGARARQPENVADLLAEGYSPTDVLEIFRALPGDAQSDFQEIFNNEKIKYQLYGPDSIDPFLLPSIKRELGEGDFDPTTIGSAEEARIRAAQGLLPQAQLEAIERRQPKKQLSPLEEAEGRMAPGDWDRAARIKAGIELGPQKPDKPEKPEKTVSAEDQFMDDVRKMLPTVSEWTKDAQGTDVMRTEDERLAIAEKLAGNLRSKAKGTAARSNAQAGPVMGPEELTSEMAAKRLEEMGYPGADPNDPDTIKDFLYLQEKLRADGY